MSTIDLADMMYQGGCSVPGVVLAPYSPGICRNVERLAGHLGGNQGQRKQQNRRKTAAVRQPGGD